jgi:nucleoside-triphosphatase THEP1
MGAFAPVPVLLITGSVGVGKTTAAFEVSEQLEALEIAHACIYE